MHGIHRVSREADQGTVESPSGVELCKSELRLDMIAVGGRGGSKNSIDAHVDRLHVERHPSPAKVEGDLKLDRPRRLWRWT